VTIRALLLPCGLLLAFAGAAQAESPSEPPAPASPPAATAPPAAMNEAAPPHAPATLAAPEMPPQRILAMLRASGFEPIGRPVRRGNLYVQRAFDPNDMEYRVVIDGITGRTVSIRPVGMPGPYAAAPGYGGPYPPPYRGPVYGRLFAPPPPDEFGYGYGSPQPPRMIPQARLSPPRPSAPATQPSASAPAPKAHATVPAPQPGTVAQAPLPRPKPYVMEATGSIPADAPSAPQKAPEPQPAPEPPKAAPPQDNGAAAMPPVAPLD
jgi:hypothetical protein